MPSVSTYLPLQATRFPSSGSSRSRPPWPSSSRPPSSSISEPARWVLALSLRPDAHSRSLAPLCASLVRQAVTFSSRVQVGGPEGGYTSDLLNFTAPTSEVNTLQDIADLSAKTQESLTAFGTDILINGSWGVTVAFAFGLAITVLAFATGHISGGQLNPAVTFALALVGQLPTGQAVANTISQIVGAILGSALLMATIPNGNEGTLGSNVIAPGVGFGNALCGEIVMTSVLVATVLETAVSKGNGALLVLTSLLAQVTRRAPDSHPTRTRRSLVLSLARLSAISKSFAPLAIGFAVFCAHAVLLPIDGCSINPARSLGPAIVSSTWPGNFWVFIVRNELDRRADACPDSLTRATLRSFARSDRTSARCSPSRSTCSSSRISRRTSWPTSTRSTSAPARTRTRMPRRA